MKMKLHEIELGSGQPEASRSFYQEVLNLNPVHHHEGLTVFDPGQKGLDFNTANHHPSGEVSFSFLTDVLGPVEDRLREMGIPFSGPADNHLGMICIRFKDPDGFNIVINCPTSKSPDWLRNQLDL